MAAKTGVATLFATAAASVTLGIEDMGAFFRSELNVNCFPMAAEKVKESSCDEVTARRTIVRR